MYIRPDGHNDELCYYCGTKSVGLNDYVPSRSNSVYSGERYVVNACRPCINRLYYHRDKILSLEGRASLILKSPKVPEAKNQLPLRPWESKVTRKDGTWYVTSTPEELLKPEILELKHSYLGIGHEP